MSSQIRVLRYGSGYWRYQPVRWSPPAHTVGRPARSCAARYATPCGVWSRGAGNLRPHPVLAQCATPRRYREVDHPMMLWDRPAAGSCTGSAASERAAHPSLGRRPAGVYSCRRAKRPGVYSSAREYRSHWMHVRPRGWSWTGTVAGITTPHRVCVRCRAAADVPRRHPAPLPTVGVSLRGLPRRGRSGTALPSGW